MKRKINTDDIVLTPEQIKEGKDIAKKVSKMCEKSHPISILLAALSEMGWDVRVEQGESDEIIEGMIVGTKEFIKRTSIRKKK